MRSSALLLISACALLSPLPGYAAPGSSPFETAAKPKPTQEVDRLVLDNLQKLNLQPASICPDTVFVRRAYLDVIGTLPTAFEAREFILDRSPGKRRVLIDRLLERDEFADYWSMRWCDLLRVKSEFPINLWPNAVQAYHHWIRTSIRNNMPYDQFARELLTCSGSNFRVPQVNFYRALQSREPGVIAQMVALTFMGERAENWPKERLAGMGAFFSQIGYKSTTEWKEEIIFFDQRGATNNSAEAIFPDRTKAHIAPGQDPREVFANWLIRDENPWFARNIANRAWTWFFGRGIIHEPDDIRPANPPTIPALLDYLQSEFVRSKYDLKHLFRTILNSQTYQLSPVPASNEPAAEANFAFYPVRRLPAEVIIDSLNKITGSTEKYSSPIPEPFTFIPEDQRAIALGDGSISSSFLELFGRASRDTGLESERNNNTSASQRLHMLNSSHVLRKLEQSRMIQYQTGTVKDPREIVRNLYLGILSRYPTQEEVQKAETYARTAGVNPREAAVDLSWALINSAEFLYRH